MSSSRLALSACGALVFVHALLSACSSPMASNATDVSNGDASRPTSDASMSDARDNHDITATDTRVPNDGAVDSAARDVPASDVMPAACGAALTPGVWTNITPPGIDATANAMLRLVPDPIRIGTLYLGIDHDGIWRTDDCGASWTKVSIGRNGAVFDTGSPWSIYIDPVEPNVLYAGSLYGSDSASLFKSTNSGVDWDSLFPPGSEVRNTADFFQGAAIDPTDHQRIVASFHHDCAPPHAALCFAESRDAGATWRIFDGPPQLTGSQEACGFIMLGGDTYLFHTPLDGVFYTADDGATWERVADGGYFDLYEAADGFGYLTYNRGMWRTHDGHHFDAVQGGPASAAISGDGIHMFVAGDGNAASYFSVSETNGAGTWMPMTGPPTTPSRIAELSYDGAHHLLYSVNTSAGLWRMVTH